LQRFDEIAKEGLTSGIEGNPVAWLAYHWMRPTICQFQGAVPSGGWRSDPTQKATWIVEPWLWDALATSIKELLDKTPKQPQDFDIERTAGDRYDVAAAWVRRLEAFLSASLFDRVLGDYQKDILAALRGQPAQGGETDEGHAKSSNNDRQDDSG
jgi:hypothetical protein